MKIGIFGIVAAMLGFCSMQSIASEPTPRVPVFAQQVAEQYGLQLPISYMDGDDCIVSELDTFVTNCPPPTNGSCTNWFTLIYFDPECIKCYGDPQCLECKNNYALALALAKAAYHAQIAECCCKYGLDIGTAQQYTQCRLAAEDQYNDSVDAAIAALTACRAR